LKKADVKTEVYAAPPAAKEKFLKKFLFGISSKRFTGRLGENRRRASSPDANQSALIAAHNRTAQDVDCCK